MRRLFLPFGIAILLLVGGFGWLSVARGQSQTPPNGEVVLNTESRDGNTREITGPPEALQNGTAPSVPNISFIDSPTAGCVQPDRTKNVCFINWYYMSVDASPNYIITMTVALNAIGNVARYQGFFQTSMYVPYNMSPLGYQVSCGATGAGGDPNWGAAYAYTIRARDSANLGSANYGTVYCPAFNP